MQHKQVWSVGMTLEEAEKNIIQNALEFYYYNKTMVANSLGISIRGLDNKMEKMNIVNLKKLSVEDRVNENTAPDRSNKKHSKRN